MRAPSPYAGNAGQFRPTGVKNGGAIRIILFVPSVLDAARGAATPCYMPPRPFAVGGNIPFRRR